ncbi:hypothetical protein ATO13_08506 [Stappia sp. 22II-S9-Z10]|nr:hypothetical protein ATO13_08506 [Stappia sp. 22II-S9-Z10]
MIYQNMAMAGLWPHEVDRLSMFQLFAVFDGRHKLARAQAGKPTDDDAPTAEEFDAMLETLNG